MAKKDPTLMEQEAAAAAAEARAELLKSRTYVLDDRVWEDTEGEEYGGKSDILILEVGEIGGPFTYVGSQSMTTELGETTVHLATDKEGNQLRLPIQATFLRSIDQAGAHRGDQFIVKRFDDQEKKRGKGAGNAMAIYGVKITKRAVVPAPVGAAA